MPYTRIFSYYKAESGPTQHANALKDNVVSDERCVRVPVSAKGKLASNLFVWSLRGRRLTSARRASIEIDRRTYKANVWIIMGLLGLHA